MVHLSVHLENGQRVYFRSENLQQQMQEPQKTTLQLSGGNSLAESFSNQLLQLGNGQMPPEVGYPGLIKFPHGFCNHVYSSEDLIGKVFEDIRQNYTRHMWISERAILAPKNDSVAKLNHMIQEMIPGTAKSYLSMDTVVDPSEAVHYPIKFLNSMDPPGCPPHSLSLKVGAPKILLRNLDSPKL
jgi:ATP-dependent DNA helicase PIF1